LTHTIEIVSYTDPYCTWCWGSEPALRHLQEAYGDQLTLRFVMGGLVEDSADFSDPMNGIGGPNWLQPIADHWVEASVRHGMPVEVAVFVKTPFTSTWPSNIAYEAAKLQNRTLADRYLRRLREVAATEGAGLDQVELLATLAEETGLDAPASWPTMQDLPRPSSPATGSSASKGTSMASRRSWSLLMAGSGSLVDGARSISWPA